MYPEPSHQTGGCLACVCWLPWECCLAHIQAKSSYTRYIFRATATKLQGMRRGTPEVDRRCLTQRCQVRLLQAKLTLKSTAFCTQPWQPQQKVDRPGRALCICGLWCAAATWLCTEWNGQLMYPWICKWVQSFRMLINLYCSTLSQDPCSCHREAGFLTSRAVQLN